MMQILNGIHSNITLNKDCHGSIFPLAKQQIPFFPVHKFKSLNLFDLVNIDIWDPCKIPTISREIYFLSIVDDYSKYIGSSFQN